MPDLNFQDLSTVQSFNQPKPVTIVSATTVAPTTFLTYITATNAIATVTPPVTGSHMLVFWPLAAFTMTTAGNINQVLTAVVNSPVLLFFDPALAKYRLAEVPAAT